MFLMEDFEPARNLGFCWAKKKVFNRPERSVPTRESLLMQDLKVPEGAELSTKCGLLIASFAKCDAATK